MNKKKLLALLMALVMTLSLMPVTALAEGEASENVAMIGEVGYSSLADAIGAVPTDGTETTIEMIADSTENTDAVITIAATKNIILDLKGKTITGSGTAGDSRFLVNYGTLTIKDTSDNADGKITFSTSHPDTSYGKENITIYNIGGTLNLQSGTIENMSNGYCTYAVNNSSNAWGNGDDKETVFNMTGGVISAPNGDAALRVYQNCAQTPTPYSHNRVTISGGTILDTGIFLDNYIYQPNVNTTGDGILTSVTITGGTVNGLIDMKLRHPFNTSLNISGGDFTNAKLWVRKHSEWNSIVAEPTAPLVNISGGKWSFVAGKAFGLAYDCSGTSWTSYTQPYYVTGGVFNVDLTQYNSIKFEEGKTGIANTAAATKDAYPYTVGTAASPVAQIGDQSYETVKEAIEHVASGETINVIADSTENELLYGVTANALKGKTVTITGSNTLTSTSPSDNRFGFYFGDYDSGIRPSDVLNVNGITLARDGGNYNTLFDGLTANLTGVTITGNGNTALSYANGARGTLTDVTVTNTGSHTDSWRNAALTVQGIGEGPSVMTVKSGTYTSANGYAVYIFSSGGTVNIEGGTFQGALCANIDRNTYHNDYNQSIINISGGTFTNVAYTFVCTGSEDAADYAKIVITGGTFDTDPTNYVAAGYEAVKNGNGTWTVVPANSAVAEIGTTKYATLKAAFDAAQNDDTITLLRDASENISYWGGKTFTLDLEGHTDTGWIDIHTGFFTLKDTGATKGKLKNSVYVYGSATDIENYSGFTLDESATIDANTGIALYQSGTSHSPAYGSIINVNGTVLGKVWVMGNITEGNSVINVSGTIRGKSDVCLGLNGFATVNVLEGADIQCSESKNGTGIEVRAGTLNVNGGQIMGHGSPASAKANGNGTTSKGAGIAISPYDLSDTTVNISGGTISGYSPLYLANFEGTDHNLTIDVSRGNFKLTDGGTVAVARDVNNPENRAVNFISGGIFSAKPAAAYIADGYAAMDNDDDSTNADYPYKVDKMKVAEKESATVTVTVDKTVDFNDGRVAADVKSNETLQTSIDTNTSVSGVVLTMDKTVDDNTTTGVQAVVNAAKAKEGSGLTNEVLQGATTVEVEVDVTVVPTEYTESKTFTFSLTPTATVTTKDENGTPTATVSGVEVNNDMIDQTQDIEVTLYTGFEPALLTHRDNQGNVIGSYTKGNTASDSTFTYDEDTETCTLIIHHFSTIEATASDSVASVDFEGGSLRRRVLVSAPNTVVNYETDFRMKFAFNLPDGATVITDNSYFYWSTSNTNPTASDRKIQITSINSVGGTLIDNVNYSYWAAMIIKGVPSSAFDTPIYCKMHLEYELDGKTYAVEMSANKTVKQIATGLAALDSTDTNLKWIEYGKYLLGDRTSYTLSEFN